ncbi:hypothetical protein JAAARDRAFT_35629 [Jaapia argillacea MUCL 33604]|uniref:Zn(2)-C6 fungal-type domain-containing protein n=1 Tax=Jaapia argillacea MUCL 33604 TaxID=933084 RepID=A0A067PQJ9_9AGAM|nr:hypothetical protein JAAARDRAFT_35629 [Jaapia argillacea MUCL 33604]
MSTKIRPNDFESSDHEDSTEPQSAEASVKKRSSRACDQCRRTKSKCESPQDGGPCKNCAAAAIACTFLGPTHKRGPPKGYIHALEQRWYQAEAILGAILASADPRAQNIISILRQDDIAQEVLNRVNAGPFGPMGRSMFAAGSTMEDLFYGGAPAPHPHGPARSQRQSRVSREIVSFSQDSALNPEQVGHWRDRLANLLANPAPAYSYPVTDHTPTFVPSTYQSFQPVNSTPVYSSLGAPLAQRRRLDQPSLQARGSPVQPEYGAMYTLDSSSSFDGSHSPPNMDDNTEGFGQLSLDENREIRYYGKSSGLHLLGRSHRTDGRNDGGVWKFPTSNTRQEARRALHVPAEIAAIETPPRDVQDLLVNLYFVHVHPVFPVIHKRDFLENYNARMNASSVSGSDDERQLPDLLLLVVLSIAERIRAGGMSSGSRPEEPDVAWDYMDEISKLLCSVCHHSRPSTCQALLLLGLRDIAIGSTEDAWLHIGMAIRMAQDLGLNRAAEHWQYKGATLFSVTEIRSRKRIWWACCIAESHICAITGRPLSICREDYDTSLPEVDPDEDGTASIPPSDLESSSYSFTSDRVSACFRVSCSLSVIISDILRKIYRVLPVPVSVMRSHLADLETSLNQWYIELPSTLQYDKRLQVPPHIIFLHIQYWSAVLLLNRGMIPLREIGLNPEVRSDFVTVKCADVCQTAASHISTLVNDYREKYGLRRSFPLVVPYVQSAGIMHVVTLLSRPSNVQALLGWRQCLAALEDMKTVWPNAQNAWRLLNGVAIGTQGVLSPLMDAPDREKRRAEEYFGPEVTPPGSSQDGRQFGVSGGGEERNMHAMAEILGLAVPQVVSSQLGATSSYYPGYEPPSIPDQKSTWETWEGRHQSGASGLFHSDHRVQDAPAARYPDARNPYDNRYYRA